MNDTKDTQDTHGATEGGDAQDVKKLLSMTSETLGRDLLQALVQEIKLLPDVWPKLPKTRQDDVIDRMRERVQANVQMAVHLIASEGRTVVAGDLDQITIKDGVKAVVKFGSHAPNLHELYEASGKAVLVVVANPAQHTGGMDAVTGEADQRAMDLGQEYDPNGDGKGMDGGEADVQDVTPKTAKVPRLRTELKNPKIDEAYGDGQLAAQEGEPQIACPVMHIDLCNAWLDGWKDWHKERNTEWWQEHGADSGDGAETGGAA